MTAVQQFWLQNRGGVPATTFFLEDFESGLGLYSTLSGNPALWSLVSSAYGTSLRMAAASGGAINSIERPVTPITFNRAQVKFRITARNSDDAGIMSLRYGGALVFAVDPTREVAYDAARRIWVQVGTGDTFAGIGSTYIDVGTWYRMTVQWLGGSLGVRLLVEEAATGNVFLDYTRPGTWPLPVVDALRLNDDNAVGASPTEWDDIYLYTE